MLRIVLPLLALAAAKTGGWLVITEMQGPPELVDVIGSESPSPVAMFVAATAVHMLATASGSSFHSRVVSIDRRGRAKARSRTVWEGTTPNSHPS